jgi:diadenosine tetraphosphate (Ap4A) HIT family hydrolase
LTTVLRASSRIPPSFFRDLCNVGHDAQKEVENGSEVTECLLEVGSDGNRLHVLQLNLISPYDALSMRRPSLTLDVRDTVLRDEADTLGIKAAAMNYFRESGLFGLPLWVFPPGTPVDHIRKQLGQGNLQGYTVRYSHMGDLGLPRSFRPDRDAVVGWLLESRKDAWTTIVHPYIDVRHSFEMLLTRDSVLIEHVPGMWESDNSIDPDVMMIRDRRVWARISTGEKNARFAAPEGSTERITEPTSVSQVQRWVEQAESVGPLFRRDLAASMPLNVHFVEDTQRRWFFLNVRRGFGLEDVAVASGEPHVVRDASDLDRWDRHSPILLRFNAERGAENRVVEIAERLLPYRDVPILIDFGLLSHPALILRELGFTLVPTYLRAGDRLLSPSYQTFEWRLDSDEEPLIRIRREPALYANEWVRVVPDRDPVVPGHLLVVAEENVKSFADSEAVSSLSLLLSSQVPVLPSRPWIFVERGRALFCTSGFTTIHAHGHLLPGARFDERAVDAFAAELGAARYDSLSDAFEAAQRCKGEYALATRSDGPAYLCVLPNGKSFEKRRIRNFFAGQIR